MKNNNGKDELVDFLFSKIEWPDPDVLLSYRIMAKIRNDCISSELYNEKSQMPILFKSRYLIAVSFMFALLLGGMFAGLSSKNASAMDVYMSSTYNVSIYPAACIYSQSCPNIMKE
jgi:hypothetical protein